MDSLSPSERRGIAAVFGGAALACLAWAFPNMSRFITIPGAAICFVLAIYFLWPEIKKFRRTSISILIAIACVVALMALFDAGVPAPVLSSSTGALMEVAKWEIGTAPTNSRTFVANLHITNRGTNDATDIRNDGMVTLDTPDLSSETIDRYFSQIKSRILEQKQVGFSGSIHPGQNTVWFSVYSQELSSLQLEDFKNEKVVAYAFGILKYRDKQTPSNKFIYTEFCSYRAPNGSIVICKRGDNRTYIAD